MNRISIASMITRSLCAFALLLATGCKKDPAAPAQTGEKKVNLYIFAEYIPDDVLKDFTKETGIEVGVATFASNDELLAKLGGGTNEFDVVSPSDYAVRQLAALKLIQKLDRAKLTNFANLDAQVLGKEFDAKNEYSVPLFWGTTGIGYNKKKITDPVDSYAILFNPKYKGQVVMLEDARELVTAALRKDGKDPNTKDVATLNAAIAALKTQRAQLDPVYDVDGVYGKLAKGEVNLAMGFNGQFYKEIVEKPDELGFVVPKEGATLWIDNLAIPTASAREENAHKLIDFLMRPDIAARTANFSAYATPNKAAKDKINKDLLDSPIIYPPADVVARCTTMQELGEAANKVIADALTQIKGE